MVFDDVADVFQKERDEDIVLVVGGIEGATESVASAPGYVVNLVLVDRRHVSESLGFSCPEQRMIDEDCLVLHEARCKVLLLQSEQVNLGNEVLAL